ncbi:MAG TPA: hypothetical protein D7H80_03385 [Candidatus Poseidoniales archaeon]|nr:hypothetical protein [Euryarchaeota archaeon]DAC08465.1 MAG TPA: hypothetical protein D7H80_03385 [Candidatus Poseidoniales archaeon]DAC41191.1 MAG TPA: hypothetical protein D7H71_01955 [Candidatus Poseidoniales archaeon]HII26273.1 hypothetical protein [Candidatus Thalassarchaeaceae archaeon]HII28777.1 hypothetical protein [Candidatus Thalassarchaeaceae archaeon]
MEDAVRQLLAVRGVRLHESPQSTTTPGFILLGVAERVPEFGEMKGSSVTVWHIPSDILPISRAEIERWCVDVSPGRHWLLSQRELPSDLSSIFPTDSQVVAWGPSKMSVWFGEAILSGDLEVSLPIEYGLKKNSDASSPENKGSEIRRVEAVINLDSWLLQKNLENAITSPVFLEGKIWEVKGEIVSPGGDSERDTWMIIEDPWSPSLSIFEDKEKNYATPNIRVILPPEERWMKREQLISKLPSLLDARRQGELEHRENSVRSIMLEWWKVDLESITIRTIGAVFPAWILNVEGREDVLLHAINGRTYPLP